MIVSRATWYEEQSLLVFCAINNSVMVSILTPETTVTLATAES